jgi:hypothetical protein
MTGWWGGSAGFGDWRDPEPDKPKPPSKWREKAKRWFGLRCLTGWCAGRIDHDHVGVYWQCTHCKRRDYAHEHWWDHIPEDGPTCGPPR